MPSKSVVHDQTPERHLLDRRFRVMIVDDLKRLVKWEDLDCSIVAEARNGRDALAKAREMHPDIVIADIRMPVMDGLQLAEELLALNPCTRVLLLTAYRDFQYARQAVRLGVCSFVLKNEMDAVKLASEVRDMQESWVRSAQEHGAARRERLKWYALAVSRGDRPADAVPVFGSRGSVAIILLAVDSPLSTILPPHSEVQVPTDHAIISRTPLLDVIDTCELAHLHSNVYVAMARIERVYDGRELQAHTESLVRSMRKVVHELSGLATTAFYSVVDCKDVRHATPVLERLFEAATYRYSMKPDSSHDISRFEHCSCDTRVLEMLSTYEMRLTSALTERSDVEIGQIEDEFQEVFEANLLTEQTIVRVLEFYIHVMEQALINTAAVSASRTVREVLRNLLTNRHRASDLGGILTDLYGRCMQASPEPAVHRYSFRVRKAMRFIESHYHKNIGVPDMAATASLSIPRFSALFRSETGLSPAAYLAEYRIERACRLLVDSTMRIGEIAAATGYSSAQYFSRVLREHTGKTPVEYREEHAQT